MKNNVYKLVLVLFSLLTIFEVIVYLISSSSLGLGLSSWVILNLSIKNVLLSRKRTLSLYLVEQAFPSLTTGKIKTYEL